jgi:hypothetical protein
VHCQGAAPATKKANHSNINNNVYVSYYFNQTLKLTLTSFPSVQQQHWQSRSSSRWCKNALLDVMIFSQMNIWNSWWSSLTFTPFYQVIKWWWWEPCCLQTEREMGNKWTVVMLFSKRLPNLCFTLVWLLALKGIMVYGVTFFWCERNIIRNLRQN